MKNLYARIGMVLFALASMTAIAGPDDFRTGTAVAGFGPVAPVADAEALPGNATFRVAFDVAEAGDGEAPNRRLESAARLLNMHAAAGLEPAQTQVAIVVHGAAALDLTRAARYGGKNPSSPLIAALIEAGVRIELCGQTAAYRDIDADDLLPGVTLQLSAMTAHALLQQQGYTLNPF